MKFVLIMLTWLGATPQMEQEFKFHTLRECDAFKARTEQAWKGAAREFVGVMVCEPLKVKK